MVSIPLFESTRCHSDVLLNLVGLACFYFCLVNNACCQAIILQGTFTRVSAITVGFFGWCCVSKDAFVMIGDDRFDIVHTAVTNFDSIPIEDFVEYVTLWKVFVDES